ncbi:hypothetical protein BZA05DRAFT_114792 [Tricharina praecox]|uniref:uncharacterized protein n=1 Tax=Tricharina praecox TaxID=43433 RepID=UPI002220D425|nr:uncharacterized protein BZA05DRAFT_114792 [Tricharina praecox]KAI5858074.1 hypothetical protein BZA05DRAFT_114792 [Tricharina praecox]
MPPNSSSVQVLWSMLHAQMTSCCQRWQRTKKPLRRPERPLLLCSVPKIGCPDSFRLPPFSGCSYNRLQRHTLSSWRDPRHSTAPIYATVLQCCRNPFVVRWLRLCERWPCQHTPIPHPPSPIPRPNGNRQNNGEKFRQPLPLSYSILLYYYTGTHFPLDGFWSIGYERQYKRSRR